MSIKTNNAIEVFFYYSFIAQQLKVKESQREKKIPKGC